MRELVIVVAAYFAYMYTRALVFSDIQAAALENARLVIEFGNQGRFCSWNPPGKIGPSAAPGDWCLFQLGLYYYFLADHSGCGRHPIPYQPGPLHYYRNIVLLTFAVALVGFMVFPLAPPRMVPEYFVDTIKLFGPAGYASREFAISTTLTPRCPVCTSVGPSSSAYCS